MKYSSAYLFGRQITSGDIPLLPPDYWINDYRIDHFHDIKTPTSSSSRPCIYNSLNSKNDILTRIMDVSSDLDCGVTGAKEIEVFNDDNELQIPYYDQNGQLVNRNGVTFRYGDANTTEGVFKPAVEITIHTVDGGYVDSLTVNRNNYFEVQNVRKVYLYAGVDTVSMWQDSPYYSMVSIYDMLFCGVAVVFNVPNENRIDVRHIAGAIMLSRLAGSLGPAWYTKP